MLSLYFPICLCVYIVSSVCMQSIAGGFEEESLCFFFLLLATAVGTKWLQMFSDATAKGMIRNQEMYDHSLFPLVLHTNLERGRRVVMEMGYMIQSLAAKFVPRVFLALHQTVLQSCSFM